jgi:hypothetical protein
VNAKSIAAWVLGGGVGVAILALAAQQWISVEVGKQLANAGIVPKAEIAIMEGDIQENADDIIRVEDKAERIATILMED